MYMQLGTELERCVDIRRMRFVSFGGQSICSDTRKENKTY